jgi:hypothetical protein
MSSGPEPWAGQGIPTARCRVCATDVPAGTFCGLCGAYLTRRRGGGPDWLRIGAYGAAPAEHVLLPSVASSLLPHLPHPSRRAFRIGLAALLLALIAMGALRWQAPVIAVSTVGLPLVFLFYLYEADIDDDLSLGILVVTAAVGAALGVGWALLTGAGVARSYEVELGAGVSTDMVLRDGLGVPLGGAALMLVPAVLVRVSRRITRESLDGFVIGALGAIAFTAAATLTRLAPQLATGLVARGRPLGQILVEAGLQGVAVPLTAAAAGGLAGAALWFTRPTNSSHQHHWLLPSVAVVVLAVYAGLGLIGLAQIPEVVQLAVQLLITVVALLALRIGLQLALLHEAHDPIVGAPLLCAHCNMVVPDMAFCPHCGVATRASSRSSRATRRDARPVPVDTEDS